jgi:signal transduction histidine kinase
VDVEIHCDDARVTLAVTDTGLGLSPDEAAKLFNDFVRIKNDRTRDILGSGLGLSLVKKLALMYGGDVAVTSQPDIGSTFTVTLQRDLKPANWDDRATPSTHVAARN